MDPKDQTINNLYDQIARLSVEKAQLQAQATISIQTLQEQLKTADEQIKQLTDTNLKD